MEYYYILIISLDEFNHLIKKLSTFLYDNINNSQLIINTI